MIALKNILVPHDFSETSEAATRYGVEHAAMEWEGGFGEIRQLQRVLPELMHQIAHRLDDLGEERIAGRLDDRLVIFPVLFRRVAPGMGGFHADEGFLDHGDAVGRSGCGANGGRLAFERAAHL